MLKGRVSKEDYVLSVAGERPADSVVVGLGAVPNFILDTLAGKSPSFILGFATAFGIAAQIIDDNLVDAVSSLVKESVLTKVRTISYMFQGIEYVACKTLIEQGVISYREKQDRSTAVTH